MPLVEGWMVTLPFPQFFGHRGMVFRWAVWDTRNTFIGAFCKALPFISTWGGGPFTSIGGALDADLARPSSRRLNGEAGRAIISLRYQDKDRKS